jgi:putative ABC transport system substrate-binding protein
LATELVQLGVEVLVPSTLFGVHRTRLVRLMAESQLPAISDDKWFAEQGGLLSYGGAQPAMERRAAYYVDKILKGTKPADLPVELPHKLDLVINLKTTKALGLMIPPTLLFQADEVIP